MGLRNFIKEHYASQQQSTSKPSQSAETAKQMYARETAQEPTNRNPVEKMPDAEKAKAVEAARPTADHMNGREQEAKSQPGPGGHADGKEALIRNQGAQGKEQSEKSPTDHGKSQTATQARSQNRGRGMER